MTNLLDNPAIAAIGSDNPDSDWQLKPQDHANALPPEAGALKRILQRKDVQELMNLFSKSDAKAVHAQSLYKRLGRAALLLYAAAAIVGLAATGLTALSLLEDFFASPLPGFFTTIGMTNMSDAVLLFQYLLVLLALAAAQSVILTNSYDNWMKARATAEITRVDLFHYIAWANENPQGDELDLLPLQLEYFRRYQLDVQLRYYRGRGGQHSHAAGRIKARRKIYGFISTALGLPIAYFIGRIVLNRMGIDAQGQGFNDLNTVFYFIGAAVPILLTTNRSLSLLSQHDRNASRYAQTYENLKHLSDEYLNAARAAAEQGNENGVLSFIRTVSEQISSEHREWISLSEDSLRHKFETISRLRLPNLRAKSGME